MTHEERIHSDAMTAGIPVLSPGLTSHVLGVSAFFLLQGLNALIPDLSRQMLRVPAAHLASLFLGAPLEPGMAGEDPLILHPSLQVAVTESCNGYGFFSLLTAISLGLTWRYLQGRRFLRELAWLLPAVWGVSLAANTARIVSAVQVRITLAPLLPSSYENALHLAVGVVVFITVLSAACFLIRYRHES